MATLNGMDLAAARIRGEFSNATDYTKGEFDCYVLVDGVMSWLDRVQRVHITVTLRPGHGSESHLFDRAFATIAAAVEGELFTSAGAAARAARNVRVRESLGYAVEATEDSTTHPVPAELEDDAEAIRDHFRAIDARKAAKKREKFVASLRVVQGEDGQWRVMVPGRDDGYWVDGIGGRYFYANGLDHRGDYAGLSGPNRGYATREEADAALAAVRGA